MGNTIKWLFQFPPFQFISKEFRELCILAIRQGPVPKHIAFVMDGNRRWAKHMNLESADGHSRGFENMKHVCRIFLIIKKDLTVRSRFWRFVIK